MKYKIEVESFEGPMDLLLHLIGESKIDIYDIPINTITEQFLEYIKEMEKLSLDIASEFLVMASTLIEIKSKMLLPKKIMDEENMLDEIDPREELVNRLIDYKKYKDVSLKLRKLESNQSLVYYKPKEEIEYQHEVILEDMKIDLLLKSINNIIKNRTKEEQKLTINQIQREEYTLEDCMKNVKKILIKQKEINFTKLLSINTTREEIITYFLAILELTKLKVLTIQQQDDLLDLIIIRREITNE